MQSQAGVNSQHSMLKRTDYSPLVGVSSWALHAELGAPPIWGVAAGVAVPAFDFANAQFSLLELPAVLAARGFDCLQICHFHLPSRDAAYLDELRASIIESGLSLHAFLADAGDITHPEHGARDAAWIFSWIEVASRLGARNLRTIAGQTDTDGALERSAQTLMKLAHDARASGVEIITENWFDLLSTPNAVTQLMERTGGEIGLLLDWSNWNGPDKYQRLAAIAPLASSCHVQLEFLAPGRVDDEDCKRCLELPYPQGFSGPFVLVNGGIEGIEVARDALKDSVA